MAPRLLLLALRVLPAACSTTPEPAYPSRVARQCADENPLDRAAQIGCVSDRERLAAAAAPEGDREPEPDAPVVLVAPSAPAGQGLVDYGRQLAAPPVRCTSAYHGYLGIVSTRCR